MANTQPPDQFKTWSEIAGYLGISVREAQYRETNEGLPIRRMGGEEAARMGASVGPGCMAQR